MALRFGPHDVQFDRAPLTRVLCQVKFSPIFALMSAGGVAGFQDAIRGEYPTLEEKRNAEVRIDHKQQQLSLAEKVPIWLLSNSDGWTVSVAADFVSLETTAYTNFCEFRDRLDAVLEAVDRTIQPSDSTRVGLRKINALSHPTVSAPVDWASLLRSEVVGLLGTDVEAGQVNGGASETQFRDLDTGTLMVRHGVWSEPAATEPDLDYHLDLDYFTDRPFKICASTDIGEMLQDFSDAITSFFSWSLLPEMYDYLGPRPRSASSQNDGAAP